MKHLLLLLFFWPLVMFGQFSTHNPGFPEMYEIKDVNALNYETIWALAEDVSGSGNSPWYSISINGGEYWSAYPIGEVTDLAPAMVFAFDANTAFIPLYKTYEMGAYQQGIYCTNDGGINWTRQNGAFENPESWPDIVHFWNVNEGVAIGDQINGEFEIYTTLDGGITWTPVDNMNIPDANEGENALIGNYDVYGDIIWFSSTKGRILKSIDRGYTWTAYDTPFTSYTRIAFKDENYGWLTDVGTWQYAQLAQTNDGGVTWQYMAYDGPLLNWDLNYIPGTASTIVTSGAYLNNGISYSYNGGWNWHWIDEPGTKFFKMDWLDQNHGWAGGLNPDNNQPLIYKYSGNGLDDFLVRPTHLEFDGMLIGQSQTKHIFLKNLGINYIEISTATDNSAFWATPPEYTIDPEGGGLILSVEFAPYQEGYVEASVIITTDHPFHQVITIPVSGVGLTPITGLTVSPDQFSENLKTGMQSEQFLTLSNSLPESISWQAEVEYADGSGDLSALGWSYGSTPLDYNSGILGEAPDQAQFCKDIELGFFSEAYLRLAFDDGCRIWINGILRYDFYDEVHEVGYWNQEHEIAYMLSEGRNRISIEVYNGVYGGGGFGGFDCELVVDGIEMIRRGDLYFGEPEAMWYYYGQTGHILSPPADAGNRLWQDINYGQPNWLKLNSTASPLNSLGWTEASAPFGGAGSPILASSPDQAQFIKDFTVGEFYQATLYLGIDDGCVVYINGNLYFDYTGGDQTLTYWNYELDVTPYLVVGLNRIGVEVYNGVYAGALAGGFDCQLTVDGTSIIEAGNFSPGTPQATWFYYGQAGQMLTPPADNAGRSWFEMDYGSPVKKSDPKVNQDLMNSLGWQYASAPLDGSYGILDSSPDKAQFIKEIEIYDFSNAVLNLNYDDGCRVWINGNLHFDFHNEDHGPDYWIRELVISDVLKLGKNTFAIEVYNGIYGGCCAGSFDCELLVDGVEVIKRGDLNYGAPEAMWYFYGQTGQMLNPPSDGIGNSWMDKYYGHFYNLSGQVSGLLNGYEADNLEIMFDANGLNSGTYSAFINVVNQNSNDLTVVPVTLNVEIAPDIVVSPGVIDFGEVFVYYGKEYYGSIKNVGTNTLQISDIQLSDYDLGFNFELSDYDLDPGEESVIYITSNPEEWMSGGFQEASLLIYSNDPDEMVTDIQLKVNILFAPDIIIENLEYLYVNLCPNESETKHVQVNNYGIGQLNYSIPQFDYTKSNVSEPITNPKNPGTLGNHSGNFNHNAHRYYLSDVASVKNCIIDQREPKWAEVNDVILFEDDMENSTNGWTIENYNDPPDLWHQTQSAWLSESHSWWCGLESEGNYNTGLPVQQALITPSIIIPDIDLPYILEFYEYYDIEDGFDQGYVDVTSDDGLSWVRIREGIPGYSDGWIQTLLDLTWLRGSTIKLRFFFDTGDDIANEFPGWFIDDIRAFTPGFAFLDASPISGSIESGNSEVIDVSFNTYDMAEGLYPALISIQSNDPDQPKYFLPCYLNIGNIEASHEIQIPQGWSGLSSYVFPFDNNIEFLFEPVMNQLTLLQDMENAFWPEQGIYGFSYWNYHQGYKIKMNSPATLFINGNLPGNRFISLQTGWNMIPTLFYDPITVHLLDNVLSTQIVKEVAGTGVYWPAYEINTIGDFQPGKSYYVYVTENELLEFPGMFGKRGNFKTQITYEEQQSPWNPITRTSSSHAIAVPNVAKKMLNSGDVLAVFNDEGFCSGMVIVDENIQNQCIVVFGDDPLSLAKEGPLENEPMVFRLYKTKTGETLQLEVYFDGSLPNAGQFASEGISAISGFKIIEIPGNELVERIAIGPNPAKDQLIISGLASVDQIEIFNINGLLCPITLIPNTENSFKLDICLLQSGVYEIRISTPTGTIIRKFVKM